MAHIKNRSNEYAQALGPGVFDAIPKSVFAAIAVSFGTQGGAHLNAARPAILREWQTLYDNGIVSQRPPAAMIAALAMDEPRDAA